MKSSSLFDMGEVNHVIELFYLSMCSKMRLAGEKEIYFHLLVCVMLGHQLWIDRYPCYIDVHFL